MTKVEAPIVGAELDSSDPMGSVKSVGMAVVGTVATFGVLAVGRKLYNGIAGETDAVNEVEIL